MSVKSLMQLPPQYLKTALLLQATQAEVLALVEAHGAKAEDLNSKPVQNELGLSFLEYAADCASSVGKGACRAALLKL